MEIFSEAAFSDEQMNTEANQVKGIKKSKWEIEDQWEIESRNWGWISAWSEETLTDKKYDWFITTDTLQ